MSYIFIAADSVLEIAISQDYVCKRRHLWHSLTFHQCLVSDTAETWFPCCYEAMTYKNYWYELKYTAVDCSCPIILHFRGKNILLAGRIF
jgi:hypothetical protein